MVLATDWLFFKHLCRSGQRPGRARRSDNRSCGNLEVAAATECLEVRIVPAKLPLLTIDQSVATAEGDTGSTSAVFTVSLSSASKDKVTVAFATSDGTAKTSDSDYQSSKGTVTFEPGSTEQTITIPLTGDTRNEPDESFFVTLSAATHAKLGLRKAKGIITNDDAPLTVSVNSPASVNEGDTANATLLFTVSLSKPSTQTVTVAFASADGTATVANSDYVPVTGTLTFQPGETIREIPVKINGDKNHEPDEKFTLKLSNATVATIQADTGTATITNDDLAVSGTVSIARTTDGSEATPPTNGKFTVTQSAVTGTDTVLSYSISGTATPGAGNDYQTLSGTVTIPAGQTTATIDVVPLNDSVQEPTETVIVKLTAFTAHDAGILLDTAAAKLTATVNISDAVVLPVLAGTGAAVTYAAAQPAVSVLPAVTVSGGKFDTGKLTISVDVAGTADQFTFPSFATLGTSTGPQQSGGKLNLEIQLNQVATAAALQTFLRGVTFSTQGTGLDTATRALQITLTDAAKNSTAATQVINVQK